MLLMVSNVTGQSPQHIIARPRMSVVPQLRGLDLINPSLVKMGSTDQQPQADSAHAC